MKVFRGRLVHSLDADGDVQVLDDSVLGIGAQGKVGRLLNS